MSLAACVGRDPKDKRKLDRLRGVRLYTVVWTTPVNFASQGEDHGVRVAATSFQDAITACLPPGARCVRIEAEYPFLLLTPSALGAPAVEFDPIELDVNYGRTVSPGKEEDL